MKHISITSALTVVLGVTVASAAQANSGGTIHFTGSVNDQTCTIEGGAGTGGGQNDFTVALDAVSANDLAAAGATTGKKIFSINVGKDGEATCVDGKTNRLSFEVSSPRINPTSGALTNEIAGGAGNTEVQLLDDAGVAINLADPANGVDFEIIGNKAQIDLAAQYLAVGGGATPGAVRTNVLYRVTYN
ncbi:fimbrial protein [Stenotrophomonas maltophilia]|uniref:fimbrial protein n=1 Tax=Stenotrophomonas maltophilia TaxID=40324 RepID=UPI0039C35169